MRSVAPINNTIDIATCPTTKRPRELNRHPSFEPAPPTVSPLPRRIRARSGREALSAGASPNTTPVSRARTAPNPRTNASMRISPARGKSTKVRERIPLTANAARAMPRPPPRTASSVLSARSCEIIRSLPAPIAARTANSRARAVARASKRLAILAQTISRTNPTAPNSIHNFGRMSATSSSRKGRITSGSSGFTSSMVGWASAYCRFKTTSSALACGRLTFGFNRPNTARIGLSGRDCAEITDHSEGLVTHASAI